MSVNARIAQLAEAIRSELRPKYHVTPGGHKWSRSTDALRELLGEIERLTPTMLEVQVLANLNDAIEKRSEYWPGYHVAAKYINRVLDRAMPAPPTLADRARTARSFFEQSMAANTLPVWHVGDTAVFNLDGAEHLMRVVAVNPPDEVVFEPAGKVTRS